METKLTGRSVLQIYRDGHLESKPIFDMQQPVIDRRAAQKELQFSKGRTDTAGLESERAALINAIAKAQNDQGRPDLENLSIGQLMKKAAEMLE